MRSSKQLAQRLRFDRFPRPDRVRRWYLVISAVVVVAVLIAWLGFDRALGERQYSPGPVLASHATFGDRCQKCHSGGLQGIASNACRQCHSSVGHSEFETGTPECRSCHLEHRRTEDVRVMGERVCVGCHADLTSKRRSSPIAAEVGSFAAHPELAPLRGGGGDPAALRFNHRIHLSSNRIAAADQLDCSSCHRSDALGQRMGPIEFESDCRRCHEQKPPNSFGAIIAPHVAPDQVRAGLQAQLLGMAVEAPQAIFEPRPSTLPGVAPRQPLSAAANLRDFQLQARAQLEASLYQPFDPTAPLLEHNHYCFLCHLEDAAPTFAYASADKSAHMPSAPNQNVSTPLAKIKETNVPSRWLEHASFAHRAHDQLTCQTCHAGIAASERTGDVNLPTIKVCQQCHVDAARQSAGTQCSLCHLYHEGSKYPERREPKRVTIEQWIGSGAVEH